MFRRVALGMLAIVFTAGCAGSDPAVAFGSNGKPLLENLKMMNEKKATDKVDRVIEVATDYHSKQNIRSDELSTIKKICAYMKAGEWEKSQALIDNCLTETNKGSGKL